MVWFAGDARCPAGVIPAKAGIQFAARAFHKAGGVASRFRGNDCGAERPSLSNYTTTRLECALIFACYSPVLESLGSQTTKGRIS